MDRFNICLPFILSYEGGNDDDPRDPGGRTSRGITQREYNAYRDRLGKPRGDVWKATGEEVADIYRLQYWEPVCPTLRPGLDLSFFDNCVNEGPVRATKLLQQALGVTADGHIGMITRAALEKANTVDLINRYANYRLIFYRGLKNFKYFGRGWTSRTEACRKSSLQMAEAKV